MKIHFIAGYFLGILSIAACASAMTYRYYGLTLPVECYNQGTLLGKLPQTGDPGWPDTPFKQCAPDDVVKGKCVIEFTEDHFKKDTELLQCRKALSDCQSGT